MNFESQVINVSLDEIIPNRFQPRLTFDDKAIEELAASIKEHGVIQPLVLRRIQDKYEIIAGERRYKAATMAGLEKVPAIITDLDDNASAEVALIENIQRKNLTAVEEAKSYKTLLDRGYLTQDALAKKLGVAQATIANKLRLLNLDEEVQTALQNEKISERHARSLLQIKDKSIQKELLLKTIEERLTVKQLDSEIKNIISGEKEVDETPLVDIGPSVEDIKTTAVDLNPVREVPSIESLLRTNSEVEEPVEIPIEPVPLAPNEIVPPATYQHAEEIASEPIVESTSPATNRFFNFLEDEASNMNMGGEEALATAPVSSPFPDSTPSTETYSHLDISPSVAAPLTPVPENTTDVFGNIMNASENTLSLNSPLDPPTPVAIPTLNITPEPETSPNVEVLDFGEPAKEVIETPIEATIAPIPETLLDPVEKIEVLSPDYVAPAAENSNIQLGDAINDIRDNLKKLEEKGINFELEELDLDNVYQVIIKIDKKAN